MPLIGRGGSTDRWQHEFKAAEIRNVLSQFKVGNIIVDTLSVHCTVAYLGGGGGCPPPPIPGNNMITWKFDVQ